MAATLALLSSTSTSNSSFFFVQVQNYASPKSGDTILHQLAVHDAQVACGYVLGLNRNFSLLNKVNHLGRTPAQVALDSGHLACARSLQALTPTSENDEDDEDDESTTNVQIEQNGSSLDPSMDILTYDEVWSEVTVPFHAETRNDAVQKRPAAAPVSAGRDSAATAVARAKALSKEPENWVAREWGMETWNAERRAALEVAAAAAEASISNDSGWFVDMDVDKEENISTQGSLSLNGDIEKKKKKKEEEEEKKSSLPAETWVARGNGVLAELGTLNEATAAVSTEELTEATISITISDSKSDSKSNDADNNNLSSQTSPEPSSPKTNSPSPPPLTRAVIRTKDIRGKNVQFFQQSRVGTETWEHETRGEMLASGRWHGEDVTLTMQDVVYFCESAKMHGRQKRSQPTLLVSARDWKELQQPKYTHSGSFGNDYGPIKLDIEEQKYVAVWKFPSDLFAIPHIHHIGCPLPVGEHKLLNNASEKHWNWDYQQTPIIGPLRVNHSTVEKYQVNVKRGGMRMSQKDNSDDDDQDYDNDGDNDISTVHFLQHHNTGVCVAMLSSTNWFDDLWSTKEEELNALHRTCKKLKYFSQIYAFPCVTQHHALVFYMDMKENVSGTPITPERMAHILQDSTRKVVDILNETAKHDTKKWSECYIKQFGSGSSNDLLSAANGGKKDGETNNNNEKKMSTSFFIPLSKKDPEQDNFMFQYQRDDGTWKNFSDKLNERLLQIKKNKIRVGKYTVKKRVQRFGEKTTKKGADVDEYAVRLMNDPMEQKNEKTQQITLLRLVNAPAASPKKSRKPRSRVFR